MNELGSDDVLAFLHAIDDALARDARPGETLPLYLIGSAALIVRYGVPLTTKDVDIVHIEGSALQEQAIMLFGKGTPNAERWGLFLEEVPQGLPPNPQGYCGRCQPIPGVWMVLQPMQPEPHDLVATKLKRFRANDRRDLRTLCDSGDITPERLRAALDDAFLFAADEEEDPGRRSAFSNLDRVIAYLEGRSKEL